MVRVLIAMVAAGLVVLLGGCFETHRPLVAAAPGPIGVGIMPQPEVADIAPPDPKALTSVRSGGSILVETAAEAAAARAQKQAMLRSVEKNGPIAITSAGGQP